MDGPVLEEERAMVTTRSPARDRLLAAANELFYAEGVHAVGIDRVIERAGVAKASLYNTFGSKDALVGEYLRGRQQANRERITAAVEAADGPRARLLAVFDAQAALFARPGYRGCPFVAASAEAEPGGTVQKVSDEYRAWVRALLTELARDAGAPDPDALARQLYLLYDGAAIAVRMDRDPSVADPVRETAALIVDAALRG
ncbi:TetR/AcrR family transcriptional regulator [Cellulomonas edaphi]|uniref:TetR/AcrR family transcriptional regulator n=1 Tax=Cellulomonas edaphi TaxID=3053468 RepID=A0ABT7S2F9_9CELL|nr:TetR/AcrR family transcriptional regulator [Cellulomons edaphi]MDM7829802.1 TetR/AcrR family transcriptional regulator [Cellulomons edaphi]